MKHVAAKDRYEGASGKWSLDEARLFFQRNVSVKTSEKENKSKEGKIKANLFVSSS